MPKRASLEERFWSKVDKNGPTPEHCPELGPCWVWKGAKDVYGYGTIKDNGRQLKAHRVGWNIQNGLLVEGECALHRCDHPACVRGTHLFKGTKLDNNRDRAAKGRTSKGDDHWERLHPERRLRGEQIALSKLTAEKIKDIRGAYAAGGITHKELASRYGVVRSAISAIIRGETWGWVE